MSPYKDDKSGNWHADFKDEHGHRRRPSLAKQGVRTEAQAKVVEAKLIAHADAVAKGIAVAERNPENHTVATAKGWYFDLPKIKKSANFGQLKLTLDKHLVGNIASMRIDLVTSGDVAAWLDEREDAADLAPRTLNNLRAYLSGMFTRLIRRNLLVGVNPVRAVETRDVEDPEPRLLPAEAVAVVIDNAVNKAWTLIFNIAAYTGMRRGEIRRLRWERIDLERRTIFIAKTKTKKARLIPIHPELWPVLDEAKQASGPVVARASWNEAAMITRAAMARGGFTAPVGVDACFHSLRHTFISHAVDCGADPWVVAWITHGPPPSLREMGATYLKPIGSLTREIAKLSWPRTGDAAERNAAALERRADELAEEAVELRARAKALRPAKVLPFVAAESVAETRQSTTTATAAGERT